MFKKCPKTKPEPPCNNLHIEKIKLYKDGTKSKCCYKKISQSKKIQIIKRDCPKTKPPPPCKKNNVSIKKKYKDGSYSVCCYKDPIASKKLTRHQCNVVFKKKYFIVKSKDTKKFINELKILGGKFNRKRNGWTFKDSDKDSVFDFLSKNKFIVNIESKKDTVKEKKNTLEKEKEKENKINEITKNQNCYLNNDGICSIGGNTNNDKCKYSEELKDCTFSDQYMKKRKKDVILVLQAEYDPNGAFDSDGDKGLFSILKSMKEFDFIYKKISSINDIYEIIEIIPDESKIAHLIIMAHGDQNSIRLTNHNDIGLMNLDLFADIIRNKLSPECSIFLHSCLVGKGGPKADNFSSKLAKLLPGHAIFGSEKSIDRGDLDILLIENKYNKRVVNIVYNINETKDYELYTFFQPK